MYIISVAYGEIFFLVLLPYVHICHPRHEIMPCSAGSTLKKEKERILDLPMLTYWWWCAHLNWFSIGSAE